MSNDKNIVNISKKCFFCNGNHVCRECPRESALASALKIKIGISMEYWIASNINCPECKQYSLWVMGTNTPSLDLICYTCYKKYEVKSKCLSIKKLPNDIQLNHGLYLNFINRVNLGLNLIVAIYGIDRINKDIYIREVIYVNNSNLKNPSIIQSFERNDSKLSIIMIKNKSILDKLNFNHRNRIISFKEDV